MAKKEDKSKVPVEPKIKILDRQTELILEFIEFNKKFVGRSRMTHDEAVKLFTIYNEYYNQDEKNYSCDLCTIRVYSRLNKVAEAYLKAHRG